MYGQFLEHIGGIVNNNIWAEMLDDRKFYYPITSHPPAEPLDRAGDARRCAIGLPIGADEFVTMDTDRPYVGDHTPMVKLSQARSHGIQQAGLAVRKGKSYAGRIVLAGAPGTTVKVSLIWGDAASDRQTVVIAQYRLRTIARFPLHFKRKATATMPGSRFLGTGTGALHVGAVSLMPANNVQGFRAEVIAALKLLHSGVYRFPGGNFVSAHEWRNAIGDPDKRPPIMDPVWHAVQPNDVGTDEFVTLCRLLDVEPYITVNAGFGDEWSAAELVEYANGAVTTPMGKWRAANGHPQPYKIKFWGIGNEPWGDYQMGAMAVDQFELKHNLFAKAMRKVDPSITLIAGGAMPDVMAGADQSRRINGQIVPDYLSKADWSGNLLAHCLDNIDMLSEHYYSSSDMHLDLKDGQEGQHRAATAGRMGACTCDASAREVRALSGVPEAHPWPSSQTCSDCHRRVGLHGRRTQLLQGGSRLCLGVPRDVPPFGSVSARRVHFRDGYDERKPNGCGFESNRSPVQDVPRHFGTIPVEVSGDSPQPKPIYPAGGDQPAVNPGSDTYPLDVSAAFSEDRKTLTFAVLNPSDSEQRLNLSINGAKLANRGHLWRMAP